MGKWLVLAMFFNGDTLHYLLGILREGDQYHSLNAKLLAQPHHAVGGL